ncbi:MAG: hypothetical protein ACYTG0_01740 [Planctomycetota bacterium]|jgi:hypothetical protein
MANEPTPQPEQPDPGFFRVRDFLLYSLSLPERTLRSATGVLGGVLLESTSLLVPQAFQNSKTYSMMIRQTLDFVVEDVGGVEPEKDENAPPKIENFVARKAVANFIDLAGMATFHLSPGLLLAVVADVAYGSQAYVKELGDELKTQGVIDESSTINHVDDLFEAVADAADTTASAFSVPPLSVSGLKKTIDDTRNAVRTIDPAKVIPESEVKRLWNEMHQIAVTQGVNPLAVSSAMTLCCLDKIGTLGQGALSTVAAVGNLFDRHVIGHYRTALADIHQKGIYRSLAETSEPYIDAVWKNFSTEKTTVTEHVLSGRLIGKAWNAARRWLGGKE